MTRNQRLALVGPPGAGKTTIARGLQRVFEGLVIASDLDALEELFRINDARAVMGNTPGPVPTLYWPDLGPEAGPVRLRTELLEHGGHDILDPEVWDESLTRVLRHWENAPRLLLEFARGADERYLSWRGLDLRRAYEPSFATVLSSVAACGGTLGIAHVTAPLEVRLERNSLRRKRGEHFVAEVVMTSVYACDPLGQERVGVMAIGDQDVPLLTVDTGALSIDETMERVARWVSRELHWE